MKPLRLVLFLLLLGSAIGICWKHHNAETPIHAEDGYLTAEQADMQLQALGISPDAYSNKQLEAAEKGDTELLSLLVAAQPGRIIHGQNGNTPLHLSAQVGQLGACEILAAHGRAVNEMNTAGQIPLHLAAANGHTECVQLLLSRGAEVDRYDLDGYTPLLYAIEGGHTACVAQLLQANATIHARTEDGQDAHKLAAPYPEIQNLLAEKSKGAIANQPETPAPKPETPEPKSDNLLPTINLFSDKPLAEAVQQGNAEQVQHLLEEGLNPNYQQDKKWPLVIIASNQKRADILNLLLEAGADPEARAANGDLALHATASSGATECLKLLLQHKANVNAQANGECALIKAIVNGHDECAKLLINAGADVNTVSAGGDTPLVCAAEKNNVTIVELLLEKGADINKTAREYTALMAAAQKNHDECVSLLIEKKADIASVSGIGRSAIHLAAMEGATACAELLLQAQADINGKDNNGDSPLHLAVQKGHIDLIRLLLTKGAKYEEQNKRHYSPLHLAAKEGNATIIPMLVEAGASVESALQNGQTPLHTAARAGHAACVQSLINAGAKIESEEEGKESALDIAHKLHHKDCVKILARGILNRRGINTIDENALARAVKNNEPDVVALILDTGCSPTPEVLHTAAACSNHTGLKMLLNITDDSQCTLPDNTTLLHTAAHAGSVECTRFLIHRNANLNARNKQGKTPLELATSHQHPECVEILQLAASLQERGYTPANYGKEVFENAKKGNHILLTRLVKIGADLTYKDSAGNTALHAAASNRAATCSKILLEAGAEPNVLNNANKTPLQLAVQYGRSATVRALLSANAKITVIGAHDNAATEAIQFNQPECLQILLAFSADINTRDNKRRTLLHLSLLKKEPKLVQILIDHGADPNVSIDDTPLLFAIVRENSPDMLKMLLTHKDLKKDVVNGSGQNAMHIAAEIGNISIMALLIRSDIPLDARDNNGLHILHYAARAGHIDLVKQLLAAGLSAMVTDKRNRFPSFYAEQADHKECAELLKKAEEAATIEL